MSHHARMASATNFKPAKARQVATALLATASLGILAAGQATAQTAQSGELAQQIIGRTIAESSPPAWPAAPQAPATAPNILLIMTDDAGFGASSTFGGAVPTPTFDRLAKNGLRYNQFNTAAICSPTRAALLTGRNPQNVGVGNVVNVPAGYPGYTGSIPKSAATVAELLKRSGYSTAMFGKAHVTPEWEQSAAGPFDRWPTGLGFQYFYGFLGGDTDQFAPSLVENTTFREPPYNQPGYFFESDLADRAIRWIEHSRSLAPNKPFFVYYAPGATHAPHSAPQEWLQKFRGQFDKGWDVLREETFARQKALGVIPADTQLTPRPDNLPAWSTLSDDQKQVSARMMESFAALLSYTDHQIGRIIGDLEKTGQLDNTLVIFIQGDNGGSAEGGVLGELVEQSFTNGVPDDVAYMKSRIDEIGTPALYNNYPAAWAWATNAPFQYYKQMASHFGGTRNGMVMSWPKRIADKDGIRQQFHFVADITPTILEAAGVEPPSSVNGVEQQPFDGISMTYTFDAPKAASHRRFQLFEVAQNVGLYLDGWWLGTTPAKAPWDLFNGSRVDIDSRKWELYDVSKDFSQSRNLAEAEPERLARMKELFWAKAAQNNVLPLHVPGEGAEGVPGFGKNRTRFVYTMPQSRIHEFAAPQVVGKSFQVTANVETAEGATDGVLVAHGGHTGGYAFYIKDGHPTFHYNALERRQYTIRSETALAPGPHRLEARFAKDKEGRGGTVTLLVDGRAAGSGRVDATLWPWISYTEGFDVGADTVTNVSPEYRSGDSRFAGKIREIVVEVGR